MTEPRIEVCVDSVAGVLAAERAGADRVELCADLLEGGLTPSLGTLGLAVERTALPVVAMLRPRGGDFCYTPLEFEVMQRDLDAMQAAGAAGVALGVLQTDGRVDAERVQQLVARARPMLVTFHRAFDMTPDPRAALATLAQLGLDRVLTSGQAPTAREGAELLREIVATPRSPIVVAAGGIRADNVAALVAATGVRELHFTARVREPSPMSFRNPRCRMGSAVPAGEYERLETSEEMIRAAVRAARQP